MCKSKPYGPMNHYTKMDTRNRLFGNDYSIVTYLNCQGIIMQSLKLQDNSKCLNYGNMLTDTDGRMGVRTDPKYRKLCF